MNTIRESWKSDKGNREDHYHVTDKKIEYYFGYNPKFVKGAKLKKIKEILEIK